MPALLPFVEPSCETPRYPQHGSPDTSAWSIASRCSCRQIVQVRGISTGRQATSR